MTLTGQPLVTYGYDNANRLTSVTQSATTVGATYDEAGQVLSETLPNEITGTYAYDDASHVTAIIYTGAPPRSVTSPTATTPRATGSAWRAPSPGSACRPP